MCILTKTAHQPRGKHTDHNDLIYCVIILSLSARSRVKVPVQPEDRILKLGYYVLNSGRLHDYDDVM